MHHLTRRATALLSLTVAGVAAVAAVATLASCDRLTATTTAVSVLTRTPTLAEATDLPAALAPLLNIDPKLLGITAAMVGTQERAGLTSTTTTPITGATVTMTWDDKRATLCEPTPANGTYRGASIASDLACKAGLEYTPSSEYTTTIATASDEFTLKVVAPNRVDPTLVTFTPALGTLSILAIPPVLPAAIELRTHALNTALGIDWSRDIAAADKRMILTLLRVDFSGSATNPASFVSQASWTFDSAGNPVFDNAPKTPSAMADFVINPATSSQSIDATHFNKKGLYVLVLTATELNTDASGNLSYGSGALAGFGTAFTFFVQ